MLMNRTLKFLFVTTGLLALSACSTFGKKSDDMGAEVSDANNDAGAYSSGVGERANFAGEGSAQGMQVGNQTYYFDFDRSEVHESDRSSIGVQSRYLAEHSNAKVVLEGHTDPRGSREYNIALGERRALSVANTLKLDGVSKAQVRTVSYGAEKPAAQGTTEEDYQQDRRVHLKYEDKG